MDTVNPALAARQGSLSRRWLAALLTIAAGLALQLLVYWPTAASAVHLWSTSSAYNYGFLILPISLFLIWDDRDALRLMSPRPFPAAMIPAFAFAIIWLCAEVMGIGEGRHVAFVGMLQSILLFALGWEVARRLAFPILYLWLMVPTGEFLIEPLQVLTRDAVVAILVALGTPVFTEGWVIEVPAGIFIVERSCAGLNFLLASLALSLLFAKLNYARWPARIACVAVAIAVSVLANIVRVFLIIAVTDWSDRQIDIASDHLLYGWAFFGVVMAALMWFGLRFADAPQRAPVAAALAASREDAAVADRTVGAVSAILLAGLLVAAPLYARATESAAAADGMQVVMPDQIGAWQRIAAGGGDWRPGLATGASASYAVYEMEGARVSVALAYFGAQRDGFEPAAAENQSLHPALAAAGWRQILVEPVRLHIGGVAADGIVSDIETGLGPRSVLHWYESAGCITGSRLKAKMCAARLRLFGSPASGAFVAVSAEHSATRADSLRALEAFAAAWPQTASLLR